MRSAKAWARSCCLASFILANTFSVTDGSSRLSPRPTLSRARIRSSEPIRLSTYPSAPLAMASKRTCSSGYEVSMITRVSGRSALICRHASMPLPPGSRMSRTTTSGASCLAWLMASATVLASPTTSISGWRSMRARTPRRTTSWSSTRRILSPTVPAPPDLPLPVPCTARRGSSTGAGRPVLVRYPG